MIDLRESGDGRMKPGGGRMGLQVLKVRSDCCLGSGTVRRLVPKESRGCVRSLDSMIEEKGFFVSISMR